MAGSAIVWISAPATFFDWQVVDHGTYDLGRDVCRIKLDQGREAILSKKFFAHGGIVRAHAGADDGPIMRFALLHQAVQIPCLMCTVEIADADMHDARLQGCAIISWTFNSQLIECRIRKGD